MGSMNPNLMKLIDIVESAAKGIDVRDCVRDCLATDDRFKGYIETTKTLDEIDFTKPEQWPWLDDPDKYIELYFSLVGHFPVETPVAAVAVLNPLNQILLGQRSDNGKWSIPGEIIRPGETVEQSAVRGIREETGLIIDEKNLHQFSVLSGKPHTYPHGDIIYSVKQVYIVKKYRGELQTNYENTRLEWFNLHDIPKRSSKSTRTITSCIMTRIFEVSNMH